MVEEIAIWDLQSLGSRDPSCSSSNLGAWSAGIICGSRVHAVNSEEAHTRKCLVISFEPVELSEMSFARTHRMFVIKVGWSEQCPTYCAFGALFFTSYSSNKPATCLSNRYGPSLLLSCIMCDCQSSAASSCGRCPRSCQLHSAPWDWISRTVLCSNKLERASSVSRT